MTRSELEIALIAQQKKAQELREALGQVYSTLEAQEALLEPLRRLQPGSIVDTEVLAALQKVLAHGSTLLDQINAWKLTHRSAP